MGNIEKAIAKFASAVRVACEELSKDMNEAMPQFTPASQQPQQQQDKSTGEPVFPEYLDKQLSITVDGDHWTIKFKRFAQKEDFAEVAKIVKQYGGDYYSMGKDSHFRIPKKSP